MFLGKGQFLSLKLDPVKTRLTRGERGREICPRNHPQIHFPNVKLEKMKYWQNHGGAGELSAFCLPCSLIKR